MFLNADIVHTASFGGDVKPLVQLVSIQLLVPVATPCGGFSYREENKILSNNYISLLRECLGAHMRKMACQLKP